MRTEYSAVLDKYNVSFDAWPFQEEYTEAVKGIGRKIIVLDDDPTGIQTVHSVFVYTCWNKKILRQISDDKAGVSFVWTNSRSMSASEAEALYRQIAKDMLDFYLKTGEEFIVIARGDSTLRGNYPQETRAFGDIWHEHLPIDAEIIIPFFAEGGRYTVEDIHYVKQGPELIPCAETEYAQDRTFHYRSSDLKEWIVEKSDPVKKEKILSISIEEIRAGHYSAILDKLLTASNFDKIIVNALDINDLKAFIIPLGQAIKAGRRYIYKTAASFINAISGILPERAKIDLPASPRGLFLVGSHTALTTRQVLLLLDQDVLGIELKTENAFDRRLAADQIRAIRQTAIKALKKGRSVCIYTSRPYQIIKGKNDLEIAGILSDSLVRLAGKTYRHADYVVAKGGITSHTIAVHAMNIKKAQVLGQAMDGVPLIEAFSPANRRILYTIFPGNVGSDSSLQQLYNYYGGADI